MKLESSKSSVETFHHFQQDTQTVADQRALSVGYHHYRKHTIGECARPLNDRSVMFLYQGRSKWVLLDVKAQPSSMNDLNIYKKAFEKSLGRCINLLSNLELMKNCLIMPCVSNHMNHMLWQLRRYSVKFVITIYFINYHHKRYKNRDQTPWQYYLWNSLETFWAVASFPFIFSSLFRLSYRLKL